MAWRFAVNIRVIRLPRQSTCLNAEPVPSSGRRRLTSGWNFRRYSGKLIFCREYECNGSKAFQRNRSYVMSGGWAHHVLTDTLPSWVANPIPPHAEQGLSSPRPHNCISLQSCFVIGVNSYESVCCTWKTNRKLSCFIFTW
jgi:hypothetical protein